MFRFFLTCSPCTVRIGASASTKQNWILTLISITKKSWLLMCSSIAEYKVGRATPRHYFLHVVTSKRFTDSANIHFLHHLNLCFTLRLLVLLADFKTGRKPFLNTFS